MRTSVSTIIYPGTTILLTLLFLNFRSPAQQVPDTTYAFPIHRIAYPGGAGPTIYIDETHHNLHTRNGGFKAFSGLLEQDGYQVKSINTLFTDTNVLKDGEILVIANALHPDNTGNWDLPNPSAFQEKEIAVIKEWVKQGGRLLLIADHMPFSGAVHEMGKAFGFKFLNGFAKTGKHFWPPTIFSTKNGTLPDSPLTRGIISEEQVDSIATFTGSAFKIPTGAMPVLSFTQDHYILQPKVVWDFTEKTRSKNLKNHHQGALLQFGDGRVAIFGEAAMFTAQITSDSIQVGFNSTYAPQNAQFILNLIHWLDGIESYPTSPSADKNAILGINTEMERAFAENDFLRIASFYSDSAVIVGNQSKVTGRKAIDNYWINLRDRGVSWELENEHIDVYKDIAIQQGISRMRFLYEGKEYLSQVRFTLIWEKTGHEWKIKIDHYSLL